MQRAGCGIVRPGRGCHTTPLYCSLATISTGVFDHLPFQHRRQHAFNTLPLHDANHFGGRTAYLREIGPVNIKKSGRRFKKDLRTVQFNVDIWCAQQTLRKRWKQRDWEVIEVPFRLAPAEQQRVIPEMYTDVPPMTDPERHDFSNIRNKVYDREELQGVLFGASGPLPYPPLQRIDRQAMTLDKFL
ncbi:hypothetical protein C3747_66g48 [Trypanosoma cruzi]|uniref:Uncharacterized protein n=2 Tax=Trypanosoma cruzi TaxID=5693 RepID=Q4D0Q8_TRYCC|nr:hypothetical protein, conserved [Trypanosoma cruzi]EAN86104.1 hypothetical protein, conserved [Trypanosoma cruzi]PWV10720.1 hypothetical protein C3747_66g48 [Trypanosoma cruzi]7AOR_aw Chain aw, mS69 [Trypanosoma cruzi strain CL Brener]|eukprot:XP_807955.1 hypothetical protein [Trypanosoma cruzi strain CL Brener]